jgi:hypothetical protein
MPKYWTVRDGKRPDSQSGPSVAVTLDELDAIRQDGSPIPAGSEPPHSIGDKPSSFDENVVAEIGPNDPTNQALPRAGFYLLPGVSLSDAATILRERRKGFTEADAP